MDATSNLFMDGRERVIVACGGMDVAHGRIKPDR
uniref:Uncharacterized protein n=1 Tax=Rhizophora mucronata TaxID=61149 RepID=A0A2P2N954_RHIMU